MALKRLKRSLRYLSWVVEKAIQGEHFSSDTRPTTSCPVLRRAIDDVRSERAVQAKVEADMDDAFGFARDSTSA
jgi:hypothetical protein